MENSSSQLIDLGSSGDGGENQKFLSTVFRLSLWSALSLPLIPIGVMMINRDVPLELSFCDSECLTVTGSVVALLGKI